MRLAALLAAALSTAMIGTAFAGTWRHGVTRTEDWWYDNGDGTWAANGWYWIDGNNDGIAECYYFDQDGWMLKDTVTPDGYTVNADGAWVTNGFPQIKRLETYSYSSGGSGSSGGSSRSSRSSSTGSSKSSTSDKKQETKTETKAETKTEDKTDTSSDYTEEKKTESSKSDGDLTKAATIVGTFEGKMDNGGTFRMVITDNGDGTVKVVESNTNPGGTWTNDYYYANTIAEGVLWAFETEDEKGNFTVKSPDHIDIGWQLYRVK